ncbi:MAG: serine/threonine protein kinase, partial [Gemmatimonadetes bacterium]|nr:serine/threonine protein kinase [Gemmatimonadota bacterium]
MDDYQRLERIFAELSGLPASEREARVRERCAQDPPLLERALQLLAHYHDHDDWADLEEVIQREGEVAASPTGLPQQVGPYTILEELGRGGMGRVYAAERAGLGKRVALKVISSPFASLEAERRFDAEQRILARLEHPGIAALLDAGVTS